MKKKNLFLALSLVLLVLFGVVLLLAVTNILSINPIYSVIFLVVFAVFFLLYVRENASTHTEQDFITTERARQTEAPKHVRDFEIVRDCCESIVSYLKEDRNIVGVTVAKNLDEFDGYYETEIDTFEFLDCLYFETDEEIDTVPQEFLAVLEDAFLARKFFQVDATHAENGIFLFKREEETFYETYYVYSENPDAFQNTDSKAERLGGCWYYVKSNKNITELLNI